MKTFFLHVPKTAGTFVANRFKFALKHSIYRYFSPEKVKEHIGEKIETLTLAEQYSELIKCKSIKGANFNACVDLNDLQNKDNTLVYAHHFGQNTKKFITSPDWFKITILRNPFERFFSNYAQRQRNNAPLNLHLYTDNYQFYFLYVCLCEESKPLELNDKNAPLILESALNLIKKFDVVFDQARIVDQFNEIFKCNCNDDIKAQDNITSSDLILNIKYSNALQSIKYIEYDYEFYKKVVRQI